MNSIISDWVGNVVTVTVKIGGFFGQSFKSKGELLKVDGSGVLIQQQGYQLFVPLASVRHITK